jgi:lysophospholipase L1-like esterase
MPRPRDRFVRRRRFWPLPGAPLLLPLALQLTLACAWIQPARGEYTVETVAEGGANSRRVSELVEARLASDPAFQQAIVMVGTNDSIGDTAILPVQTFEANVRAMLQRLQDAGIETVVSEIPPAIDPLVIPRHPELTDAPTDLINLYNAAIHRAAAATKPVTTVIPMYDFFLPNTHLLADSWIRNPANGGGNDGVHPTIVGSGQIARLYSRHVLSRRYGKRGIVLFGDSITNGQPHGEPWRPGDFLWRFLHNDPPR